MASISKTKEKVQDCIACKAECCKSVTIELNTPKTKKDFDEIKWFVLHKNVQVYIDYSKNWNVEFITPCKSLSAKHRCTIYKDRPTICRLYPKKDEICVYQDNACKMLFTTIEQVEEYCAKKKKRRMAAKARSAA